MINFYTNIFLVLFLFNGATYSKNCSLDPSTIKKIKANTLKIIPYDLYAPDLELSVAKKIYVKECENNQKPLSFSQKLNCLSLQRCKQSPCIQPYAQNGSAFLINNGRRLITAWHITHGSHQTVLTFFAHALKDRIELLKNEIYPDFVLLNHENKVVFDTRDLNRKLKYTYWGDPLSTVYSSSGKKDQNAYGFYENIPVDYVAIDLPYSLGDGLKISAQKTKAIKRKHNCVYSAGYPLESAQKSFRISNGTTDSFQNLIRQSHYYHPFVFSPLPKSKEKLLNSTIDEILLYLGIGGEDLYNKIDEYGEESLWNSFHKILKMQQRTMRDLKISQNPATIFFQGIVHQGQSGGPILNSKGQVLGITTNQFRNDLTKKLFGGAGVLFNSIPFEK